MIWCAVFFRGHLSTGFAAPTAELCTYMRMGYNAALQEVVTDDEELEEYVLLQEGSSFDEERAKRLGLWEDFQDFLGWHRKNPADEA